MKKSLGLIAVAAFAGVTGVAAAKGTVSSVKADTETIIKPFADYRFQDATNLGKDTSGNGFDLVQYSSSDNEHAIEQLTDTEGKYLSIKRDDYPATGVSKNTGAFLYAPQLGNTGKDWSDLIQGDYTVSTTIKGNTQFGLGDRYSISFGRYNSALTFVAWRNCWDISYNNSDFYDESVDDSNMQTNYLEAATTQVPGSNVGDDWVNLTVVGDTNAGTQKIYVNGVLKSTVRPAHDGVRLTNTKTGTEQAGYTFCIGAQCDIRGSSIAQYSTCQYRNVTVYDCALSEANVTKIVGKQDATVASQGSDVEVVTGLTLPDVTGIDFDITNENKLDDIIKNQLGEKKVKVATSGSPALNRKTVWYPNAEGTKIIGKPSYAPGVINPTNSTVSLDYQLVAKLDCDLSKVDVSEVTLGGAEYTFGTAIEDKRQNLSFVLTPKKGVTIESVTYDDEEWDPEDDGSYFISITTKGAVIHVETSGSPASEKGCGGSIIATTGLLTIVALAGAVVLARKKED